MLNRTATAVHSPVVSQFQIVELNRCFVCSLFRFPFRFKQVLQERRIYKFWLFLPFWISLQERGIRLLIPFYFILFSLCLFCERECGPQTAVATCDEEYFSGRVFWSLAGFPNLSTNQKATTATTITKKKTVKQVKFIAFWHIWCLE